MEKFDRLIQDFGELVNSTVETAVSKASIIPGSSIIVRYIKSSYQNDPVRSIFELLLLLFAIQYILASKYSTTKKNYVKLEPWEIDELVEEWEPEPLVSPLSEQDQKTLESIPVIKGSIGPRVLLTSEKEIFETRDIIPASLLQETSSVEESLLANLSDKTEYLNFTSPDIFNVNSQKVVRDEALKIIETYGVGSCGPAGFYGNQDQHLQCEKDIAKFIGTEAAILYSQGFATPSSVIPCFFKRGDYIVADECVNISLQKGIILSRAHVYWYKHNDMDDLEAKVAQAHRAHRRGPLPRRIIIAEGISELIGDSPDLKRMVEIKKKYKFRIVLDESLSLGVLGKTGRGLPEAYNVPRSDIDITLGSLANFFGSAGGFCAGKKFMVEYQQITSLAYTFSATMPPYLAHNTSVVINNILDSDVHTSQTLQALKSKSRLFVETMKAYPGFNNVAKISSLPDSPYVVIKLQAKLQEKIASIQPSTVNTAAATSTSSAVASTNSENTVSTKKNQSMIILAEKEHISLALLNIMNFAKQHGILIGRQFILGGFDKFRMDQGIKLFINCEFTEQELEKSAKIVAEAVVKSG